jgi:hypothetical protein
VLCTFFFLPFSNVGLNYENVTICWPNKWGSSIGHYFQNLILNEKLCQYCHQIWHCTSIKLLYFSI